MSQVPPGIATATGSPTGSGAPGRVPLRLGAVTFWAEEAPAELPIGAVEQMIAVHNLVGGGVNTQSLGPKPQRVQWVGMFFAGTVSERVDQVRAYCVSGQEVLLSWNTESYYCKVREFIPKYRHRYLCDYQITVEITRDANGAFSTSSSLSIDQQVAALQADIASQNAAVVAADSIGAASFQGSIAGMNAAIANASPLSQNIVSQGTAIINAVNTALAAVNAYIGGLSSLSPQYAATSMLAADLSAIAANVLVGQSPKTTNAQGGSLFSVAAAQYGDITQAFALQQANGLVSVFITSTVSKRIVLPQVQST